MHPCMPAHFPSSPCPRSPQKQRTGHLVWGTHLYMWPAGFLMFRGVGGNLGPFPEAKQKQIQAGFRGEVLSCASVTHTGRGGDCGGHGLLVLPREGVPVEKGILSNRQPLGAAARRWNELLIFSAGLFIWLIQRKPAHGSVHKGYLWRKFMHLTA